MVLVLGSEGNMGKRYCAILRHIREPHIGLDVRHDGYDKSLEHLSQICDKIIIATPTKKHLKCIQDIGRARQRAKLRPADVLCEKPVVTDQDNLKWVRKEQDSGSVRVYCVNQYAHMPSYSHFCRSSGRTYYNYFKHGDDGLAWDCFQMFVLARGDVVLSNRSPIWTCRINGVQLAISSMDMAYAEMIRDFLGPMRRTWDLDTVEIGTKRVLRWIAEEQADIIESQTRIA